MDVLVSIVVPIYNVEKYLNRCIESIVNQTYTNLEIILVDDGSPDNCPAMCDDWAKKDKRIKVIHKENAGLGMARNTGIDNATGDYICFFDSDDYVALDTIEKTYKLAKSEQVDIVLFGFVNVDSAGNVGDSLIPFGEKKSYRNNEVQQFLLPDLIDNIHLDVKIKNLPFSACSCLYSMELIKLCSWRFVSEREYISEDCYSLIWLYKYVNSAAILSEALYFCCDNVNSLSRTYRSDRFEKIKTFYFACIELSKRQGYSSVVQSRIGGLTLSSIIAAMKHIVSANIEKKQKKEYIAQIMKDDMTQSLLRDKDCRYNKKTRNILFWAIRNKLSNVVYLLLWLQIRNV